MADGMPSAPGRMRARNLLSSYYGVADDSGPVSSSTADDDDVRLFYYHPLAHTPQ